MAARSSNAANPQTRSIPHGVTPCQGILPALTAGEAHSPRRRQVPATGLRRVVSGVARAGRSEVRGAREPTSRRKTWILGLSLIPRTIGRGTKIEFIDAVVEPNAPAVLGPADGSIQQKEPRWGRLNLRATLAATSTPLPWTRSSPKPSVQRVHRRLVPIHAHPDRRAPILDTASLIIPSISPKLPFTPGPRKNNAR